MSGVKINSNATLVHISGQKKEARKQAIKNTIMTGYLAEE